MSRFVEDIEAITAELGRRPSRREFRPEQFRYIVPGLALLEYHADSQRLKARILGREILQRTDPDCTTPVWLDSLLPAELALYVSEEVAVALGEGGISLRRWSLKVRPFRTEECAVAIAPLSPLEDEPPMALVAVLFL